MFFMVFIHEKHDFDAKKLEINVKKSKIFDFLKFR